MSGPTYNISDQREKGALPPDQEKVALETEELEKGLNELKARFDQFFLGIERRNPTRDAEAMRGRLVAMKSAFIRNTALKFRIQSLYQKFLSYERLWQRTLKEMEEGTYRRDLLRLRHKNELRTLTGKAVGERMRAREAADASLENLEKILGNVGDLEASLPKELFSDLLGVASPQPPAPLARTSTSPPREASAPAPVARTPTSPPREASAPAPVARMPTRPPCGPTDSALGLDPHTSTGSYPVPIGGRPAPSVQAPHTATGLPLSDEKVRAIYDAYITAKRRCKESTEGITFGAVAQSLHKQVPAILNQKGVTSVDFKVVIKNGKAVLKAVPK